MRVAGIDIGTNTIRLLVADVIDGAIIDVARRSEVVGLGRGLETTGIIATEALELAGQTLEEYSTILEVTGPDQLRVVATAASRQAVNSDELVSIVYEAVGVKPEIILGEEEAALSFAGARWGTTAPGPHLVIDPGGGSTEFVFGDMEAERAESVDIGSIRLTERMPSTRPMPPREIEAARDLVSRMFSKITIPSTPRSAIGVAGTFRTLASLHLDLGYYDRNMTHGVVLAQADLDALVERLAALTVPQTDEIPSLPPGRAPVILGGAIVASEAVRRSGVDRVTISKTGLLQGIVLGLAQDRLRG